MRYTLLLAITLSTTLFSTACEPEAEEELGIPDNFLWGSASAGWQVEGDYDPDPGDEFPVRSNWTVWTERGCVADGQSNPEGSGFYNRYEEDFGLAQGLGTNAYRLGIDWARIEPSDNQWNESEIEHYVSLLQAAHEAGLQPMVTFWHWVVPTFIQNPTETDPIDLLVESPGPDSPFVVAFEDFVRKVAPHIAPYVDLYSVLNEPFSVIGGGYFLGDCGSGAFPPGRSLPDLDAAVDVFTNLAFAHAAGCRALKELDTADSDGDGEASLCGQAASTNIVRPLDPANPTDVAGAERIDWIYNSMMMSALVHGDLDLDFDQNFDTTMADDADLPLDEGHYPELEGSLDWIGVNYYGPVVVEGIEGSTIGGFPMFEVDQYNPSLPHSSLGFAIDAPGLGEVLDAVAGYGLPIYITENGIGDADDSNRPMFLVEHVDQVQQAVQRGVDVRGYFHWSLTDNFEWAHGFEQRFGLYRVDFDDPDLPRTRQGSVDAYESVIAAGGVTDAIRDTWLRDRYPSDSRP